MVGLCYVRSTFDNSLLILLFVEVVIVSVTAFLMCVKQMLKSSIYLGFSFFIITFVHVKQIKHY